MIRRDRPNQDVFDRGSLPAVLAARARQASDRRLVIDAAAGLIGSAAFAVLQPPLWLPLSALAFCLGAFGVWGILDREANDAESQHPGLLTWSRAAIAVAGGIAAVIGGIALFFGMLGPLIS